MLNIRVPDLESVALLQIVKQNVLATIINVNFQCRFECLNTDLDRHLVAALESFIRIQSDSTRCLFHSDLTRLILHADRSILAVISFVDTLSKNVVLFYL